MVKKGKRSKISIKQDSDSDDDGGNNDGFAVMDNEVYDDETPVDVEAEKLAAQQRKKQKKLEQLDRKIKRLSKHQEKEKTIVKMPSEIKNRHKRQEVVVRKKQQAKEERLIEKLKKRKVREEQGEEAMPRGVTNTIESMRVADETLI